MEAPYNSVDNDLYYTAIHLHTDLSNQNMVEVVNTYKQYVDKAVEMGHKAIAFTEHGNVLSWFDKKTYAESNGLKYIHGSEVYVTMTLEEKKRDNFHMILLAKNHEGFKELNKMVSTGFDREGNNFYYNPRISWEDIKNTSENIIISTACLGGIIWQLLKNKQNSDMASEKLKEVIAWFSENKERCFLEIQPHYHVEQIQYNKILKSISEETGIRLVAGSDTHALNEEYDEARKVLQKSKRIKFTDEDSFDLGFHSYEKMFQMFKRQDIFTDDEIHKAMQMTNIVADMIESWQVDYSKKYPKLYENPEEVFQKKIAEGIKFRGIDKLPLEERKVYAQRIQQELDVYKANDAINYMLLEDDVKSFARKNDIEYGFGRGSVTGSIIAYLMRITHMDSIKRNLNFARFMSKERISLADIDTDYPPSQRHIIQDYLINHPKLHCAKIITYNKLELLSAIRDIGRGLDIPLSEVDEIAKGVEENESYYRDKYPDLFHYVDLIKGTIVSVGAHACGIAVSPIPLDENMGLLTVVDNKTKETVTLTQINMKEIDKQNFVKLDVLGLDTVELIANTAKLSGLNFEDVLPENLDSEDTKVWKSILDNNIGIFQWESDYAHQSYKDLFDPNTIAKIKVRNPNVSYIDLFSLGNASIRPSGASYRDRLYAGEFNSQGLDALDEFLSNSQGFMVYQEQIIRFLVQFCNYSEGEADVVRRAIGKKQKEVLDDIIPEIKERFINTLLHKYNVDESEVEEIAMSFIQVIMDASDYGFSINHSDAYSWMGYASAWLRYYYPLEFITANLNVNIGKQDKTNKLVEFAKEKNIDIRPIKFRYSRAGYMFDKETNSIYQGVEPIKYLNANVAEGLYRIGNRDYDSFTDLLVDIKDGTDFKVALILLSKDEKFALENDSLTTEEIAHFNKAKEDALELNMLEFLRQEYTEDEIKEINKGYVFDLVNNSVPINSRQMQILISLGYFSEFGGNKKLLSVFNFFEKTYKPNLKLKTKKDRYTKVLHYENDLNDESLSLVEQCESELEFLGHVETVDEEMSPNIMMITEVLKRKTYTRAKAYQFSTGETREFKVGSRTYQYVPFDEKDIVQILHADVKPKNKKINGVWQQTKDKELWLKELKFIRKQ
ncbi:PHP domain-containing protein [Virgibacillus sp. M23]|uniref:PHP domain-containing protein n=1 Tax=Virgibacillus sp. M23 TaxID=3079030 RepID=UPI002A916985|nr:PHP domain-containing protein [Virgibacillus sp. M23]MDY7043727.1 PHP domain-containing protein [Virgibacillus sp. M23]